MQWSAKKRAKKSKEEHCETTVFFWKMQKQVGGLQEPTTSVEGRRGEQTQMQKFAPACENGPILFQTTFGFLPEIMQKKTGW